MSTKSCDIQQATIKQNSNIPISVHNTCNMQTLPVHLPIPQTPAIVPQAKVQDTFVVPTSPVINLFMDVLTAGENINTLRARKKLVSNAIHYDFKLNKQSGLVRVEKQDHYDIELNIADMHKIQGSNKDAKKLFVLLLIKANQQALCKGTLTRDNVSFSLSELIDLGLYKTPQSARKGFKHAMDVLTSLTIRGTFDKIHNEEYKIKDLAALFTASEIKKSQCKVYLNTNIDWRCIVEYYTILPRYYFALENRASELLYYIFYLARQRTKEIAMQGYYNISLLAIQQELYLPNATNCKNPKRDIQNPISTAIAQIETAHRTHYGNNIALQLMLCANEQANAMDYLDNGYLKIALTGDYAKNFIQISQNRSEQIAKACKAKNKSSKTSKYAAPLS